MNQLIGYARVSSLSQNLDSQIDPANPNMSYTSVAKVFNATIIQKYTQNLQSN